MYDPATPAFDRKQLAGWVDLFLEMRLMTIKRDAQNKNDELAQWKQIAKCILVYVDDFRPSRAIEVFQVTKIFNEKKTKQLIRLINLRSRDLRIGKTGSSDDTLARSLASSTKNISFCGNGLESCMFLI